MLLKIIRNLLTSIFTFKNFKQLLFSNNPYTKGPHYRYGINTRDLFLLNLKYERFYEKIFNAANAGNKDDLVKNLTKLIKFFINEKVSKELKLQDLHAIADPNDMAIVFDWSTDTYGNLLGINFVVFKSSSDRTFLIGKTLKDLGLQLPK